MKLIYIALGFGILTAAPRPQSGDRLEEMKADLVESFLHEAGMETREDEDDGQVVEERRVTKVFVEEEEGPVESSIDRLIEDIEELQGEEAEEVEEEEILVEVIDEQVLGDEVVISEDDLIVKNEIELIDEAPEVDPFTGENYEELDEYYDPIYLRGHLQRNGGRGHGRGRRGHGRRRSRH
ncbi:hypothetical protein CONCODRAFT_82932 [Conidiobolus coronatus NRRL 28638]|uniref:Uncharacterized protein n=1 Tax=Conidiobolus coronatus (strain ATCC 28846 / CBS 209.66 / NRRL 28638) TaxID=796925 RepID=A0A137PHJ2_CONC2|nr:hypothetical protein CONCODRAFT_82932 [Conidiobolus coronatus NRRL 28638]|eukprot:KXN74473.1 hypothetical protein CONCODRAFT_82932 [Conidiobolus coronatus NRRL 28638]